MVTQAHHLNVDGSTPGDNPEGRNAHFARSELILLVEHTNATTDEASFNPDDSSFINNWLNQLSEEVVVNGRSISFKRYKPDNNPDNPDEPLVIFPNGNNRTLHVHVSIDDGQAEERIVVEAVNQLNARIGLIGENVTFLAASPNWLFCGATHGFGDGGPGGLPSPIYHDVIDDYKFYESILGPIKAALGEPSGTPGQAVNVVILDTAYSKERLDQALKDCPRQSLLQELYISSEKPNHEDSPLKIHTAAELGIQLPPSPTENPAYYHDRVNHNISDHGLFIAGIIHSWAPNAKIHLFEVLNPYGVCTLMGLEQTLKKLEEAIPPSDSNPPLIINCSFFITFPQGSNSQEQQETPVDEQRYKEPQLALVAMRSAFQRVLDTYKNSGVSILAAAGNDASLDALEHPNGAAIPATRYPAAFNGVIGVGALDRDGERAEYSNQADVKPYGGLMVFGGRAVKAKNEKAESQNAQAQHGDPGHSHTQEEEPYISDAEDSVLGIYIGEFPEKTKPDPKTETNITKGWAAWSGTSFATAMMSGIFAALAGDGYKISSKESNAFVAILKNKLPRNLGRLRGNRGRISMGL
jgi:hypothetical protein